MVGRTALGKYTLVRPLGAGSNAEVFLAQQPRGGPPVVVKVIHPHVTEHPKFRQLFDAEVRSMANFQHPYAVRLIDAAYTDPLGPCLVMEYVPGVTLEAVVNLERVLEPERAGRLLGFLGHALQAAHEVGIIHRDLKPANLMVLDAGTPHESLKVMDFGFAGFSTKPHIQLAELTGHGPIHAIGTPAYVSPEMIRGDPVDTRSDLYSVGVILYELLTGRLPFTHRTQEKLLAAHVKDSPPRFHKIGCGHVPPATEMAVHLALSKYANERQQCARELVADFGRGLGIDFWEATAPAGWEPPAEPEVIVPPAPSAEPRRAARPDPFRVASVFEIALPERMAAAKIRGFVEDFAGQVVSSEPGLILLQLGLPHGYKQPGTSSGIFGWLGTARRPAVQKGNEPIEVQLHMDKPDPQLTRLRVEVACRPVAGYTPGNLAGWRDRCDKVSSILRQYLGA
ncbi:serine/threonine protein kinase [Urbifossiella limnaea]|uniref:Serine/threonine-protein kinase PknB n=1 Tax=Urbifossiella limnaea TaxID=2528023 RepID=A0A517XR04_9BACT|nr:serine/threonine-protein kinase [Urbifossiella limnaea]QDU19926.1 Serine/threonine-protein kinase PknB [Urbifossiella limnaea]